VNFRRRKGDRRAVLLDMTPLIDVVFLLLIFFLITTTFIKRREDIVPVSLPTGSAERMPTEPGETVTIHVDEQGAYSLTVGERPAVLGIERQALVEELNTLYATDSGLTILLRGDRDVNYGAVMDIWMIAQEVGFERVHAVIRQPRGQGAPDGPAPTPP